jgi:hypothetical protein
MYAAMDIGTLSFYLLELNCLLRPSDVVRGVCRRGEKPCVAKKTNQIVRITDTVVLL